MMATMRFTTPILRTATQHTLRSAPFATSVRAALPGTLLRPTTLVSQAGAVQRFLSTSTVRLAEPIGVEVESSPASSEQGEEAEHTEGEKQILGVLQQKFAPSMLSVTDVSGGCGAFYTIVIVSKVFNGLSTLKQHRLVQGELKSIIKDIHGLQLHTVPEPEESEP